MPYVGEIRLMGTNWAPVGWEKCNGQLLAISENETLFTIIGTTYGGDGESTFALPNLQSRIPMHKNANGPHVIGEMAGTEEVTLTSTQMPNHTHAFLASTALANQPTPGGNLPAQSGTVQLYTEDSANVALAPQSLAPTGGSQPHDNMHPYYVVTFIISLYGEFPNPT
ncbi:MAG TPA: tail fiber protein [Frankiaceae bacterium]|jgi:microcystin-dependent protein|nr:tail fiber protein [Frankiaceae bacterium]